MKNLPIITSLFTLDAAVTVSVNVLYNKIVHVVNNLEMF